MRFIKKTNLVTACQNSRYSRALPKALVVIKRLKGCEAQGIQDLKLIFGKHVDAVGVNKEFTCFDLSPEAFRLITVISYKTGIVYFKDILTHKEYENEYVKRR